MSIRINKLLFGFLISFLISPRLFSQIEKTDKLQKQFLQYQSQALQEKIFAHIDKTFYLAGETIWFKLYDVDAYHNKPLSISSVAYAEIINKDQRAVLQTMIELKEGSGNGSFTIPSSLASGNYEFRCYTNWMKNFDPDFYFEHQLVIVNTLKAYPAKESAKNNSFSIQFFPEGGNLVEGLTSKVAFKATAKNGEGISCSGIIINQKKDTIANFQSLQFGIGHFILTPKKNDTYFAVLKIQDSIVAQQLPLAYEKGYVMSLQETDNDKIKITVRTNNLQLPDPTVYLFAHSHHLIKKVQANYFSNGEANFILDKKNLEAGISHITIFNSGREPVCERLFFVRPENKLSIAAIINQQEYTARKKVTIDFNTTDQLNKPVTANMSMSVFLIDSFQSLPRQNIANYFLLTSDLKGEIETPQYYFENSGAEVNEATDNLMLTQGWRRFKWSEVLQNKKPFFDFLPEIEGPVINGRIIDRKTSLPVKETVGYLTIPGKHFEFSTAVSKENGQIKFVLNKLYGRKEMIVQTNNQTDSNYRIDITNSFSDKPSSSMQPDFSLSKSWETQLLNRSINMQVENSYLTKKKNGHISFENTDTTLFYGKPEDEYYLDDYTRFVTMEEVMREYIMDVRVRKQSDKFHFRVRNSFFNTFFETDPLILIDGLPVFDADKIMAVDPLKIKKVDVIAYKYYKGPLVSDGVVSYKTYDGDLAGYQLDPNAVVLDYEGLQEQKEFYSPVYEQSEQIKSPIPDFRNLLMWSPEIKTDGSGKNQLSFYTSDVPGKFAVFVQGMSNEGLLGSTIFTFTVVSDKQ